MTAQAGPATALVAARAAMTTQSTAIAVTKKAHQMEMQFIQTVDKTARAAPPPGQGSRVDKLA